MAGLSEWLLVCRLSLPLLTNGCVGSASSSPKASTALACLSRLAPYMTYRIPSSGVPTTSAAKQSKRSIQVCGLQASADKLKAEIEQYGCPPIFPLLSPEELAVKEVRVSLYNCGFPINDRSSQKVHPDHNLPSLAPFRQLLKLGTVLSQVLTLGRCRKRRKKKKMQPSRRKQGKIPTNLEARRARQQRRAAPLPDNGTS